MFDDDEGLYLDEDVDSDDYYDYCEFIIEDFPSELRSKYGKTSDPSE